MQVGTTELRASLPVAPLHRYYAVLDQMFTARSALNDRTQRTCDLAGARLCPSEGCPRQLGLCSFRQARKRCLGHRDNDSSLHGCWSCAAEAHAG
jgi:hypothetical protein